MSIPADEPNSTEHPPPRRVAIVVGGGAHRAVALAQLFMMSEPVQTMSQPVQVASVCGGCGHDEAVHAGGTCLHGGILDGCDCHGFLPSLTLAG